MHLVPVGVCFVTTVLPAVLLGAEIQPSYYGTAPAVAADKSLLVDPPPDVRTLRSSRSAVFEVPPELRVWDFHSSQIDAGPLLLRPMRKPYAEKPDVKAKADIPISANQDSGEFSEVVRLPQYNVEANRTERLMLHIVVGEYVRHAIAIPIPAGDKRRISQLPFYHMKRGDVILSIDGRDIRTFKAGESFGILKAKKLVVLRRSKDGGIQTLELNVTDH